MALKQKKVPVRMCVACRQGRPKKELIRIVRNKEGTVGVDLTGKAQGRGAYLCPDVQCLERAVKALSQRARQELEALCRSCGRELMFAGPDGRLGQAVGKQSKVVGVTKQAFSQRLKEIYPAQRRGGESV